MLPKRILNENDINNLNNMSSENFNKHMREYRRIFHNNEYADASDDDEYANVNFEKEFNDLKRFMDEIISNNDMKHDKDYYNKYENENENENEYLYNIENHLIYDLATYLKINEIPKRINILPYQINKSGLKPFVQYFLMKCPDNKLSFISYEGLKTYKEVQNKCMKILEVLFLSYMKISYGDYKGFKVIDDEIYIFYDCSRSQIGLHCLKETNEVWLTLMHEIINTGMVCNYEISEKVKNLFIYNEDLIYLKNSNNIKCELPVVVYYDSYDKQIEFTSIFGVSRCRDMLEGFAGLYFYFYSYNTIIERLKREQDKKRKGIIRIALFLGNMKVPMNLEEDEPDKSQHTRDLLLKDSTTTTEEYKIVRSMLKISDRDGLWTQNYDSVYCGKIKMTDAENKETDMQIWVAKEYEQQMPLTYHIMKI